MSVELEGKVCLPIKTLLDITNELPETRITIIEKKLNVTIETKFGKYNIMGKSYEEFPAIPIIKEEKYNFIWKKFKRCYKKDLLCHKHR